MIIRLVLLVITNIVITSDQNHQLAHDDNDNYHLTHDDNLSSRTRCLTAVGKAIALQVIQIQRMNEMPVRGQCSILDDMMVMVVVDRGIVYQVIDFDNDLRFEIL